MGKSELPPQPTPYIPERPSMPPESALRNGMLVPLVSKVFEDLQVAASICRGPHWFGIHHAPNLIGFELDHGTFPDRLAYNKRCIELATSTRSSVLGEHGGLCDLFVPILVGDQPEAFIVTGPFATMRATSSDVLSRFRAVVGRQGHLDDPEFSSFLDLSLSTLVLGERELPAFRRLIECLALLMAGEDHTPALGAEVEGLLTALVGVRFVERVWQVATEMVDERMVRGWSSYYNFALRNALGLRRFPEDVVVGLFLSQSQGSEALDDLVRRHAFQRACVELARVEGDTISGQIGGYGVTFLSAAAGSNAQRRRRLQRLSDKARLLAEKDFGLRLHLGIGTLSLPLPRQYQAALGAAEAALSRGEALAHAEQRVLGPSPLGKLRDELASMAEQQPSALPARFEAFLEAVAGRSAYRPEAANVHLEVTFERMASSLLASGAIDPKSLQAMHAKLEQAASDSGTITELFATYRRAVRDLADAAKQPGAARHDRSLGRADEYIAQHYAQPLTTQQVAKVAGFAQSYFFELFQKRHGVTFVKYLTQLRIDRAKELLSNSTLNLQRVAELSGLSTQSYLSRVFKRLTGETPAEYRARVRPFPKTREGRRRAGHG
ncbi:MAG TPA: helix-turn-helix domain-containing protein [Polyangiaceae bacterium]|nr:helix-turn-helix domain-containing protein [Polyangiaceae bacterium]